MYVYNIYSQMLGHMNPSDLGLNICTLEFLLWQASTQVIVIICIIYQRLSVSVV